MKNIIGFELKIEKDNLNSYLFGEDQARYAIAVEENKIEDVRLLLNEKNVFFEEIGQACKDKIIINNNNISILELKEIYENWFNNYLSKA